MINSTVVEHLTHNPKVKDLNPTTGIGRDSTVVKLFTCNPKAEGSNPATGTGRERERENDKELLRLLHSSTMAEHLPHNLKVMG